MANLQKPEALRDWEFVRYETYELLDALSDKKLAFMPEGNKRWQPLSYQFACMGRTQLVYAWALAKGFMDQADFSGKGLPNKQDIRTRSDLRHLLEWADQEWFSALGSGINEVRWLHGQSLSRSAHLYRLVAHERLHHGQIISYFTLADYKLPAEFKRNWAL